MSNTHACTAPLLFQYTQVQHKMVNHGGVHCWIRVTFSKTLGRCRNNRKLDWLCQGKI